MIGRPPLCPFVEDTAPAVSTQHPARSAKAKHTRACGNADLYRELRWRNVDGHGDGKRANLVVRGEAAATMILRASAEHTLSTPTHS
jgi:hypothetical protein